MFGLFRKTKKMEKRDVSKKKDDASSSPAIKHKKPGQSNEFRSRVLRAKLEVVEAIKNADKQRALDSLIIFSDLAAQAIYEHDLRAMIIINTTIDEINHNIDVKLKATGEPEDLIEDMDETRVYLMIRLAMLPVCSMMNALQRFSSAGMDEVNNDIDSRIGQIRQFVMEHEKAP